MSSLFLLAITSSPWYPINYNCGSLHWGHNVELMIRNQQNQRSLNKTYACSKLENKPMKLIKPSIPMKCLGVQLSVACQKIHSKVKNMFLYFEILTSKKWAQCMLSISNMGTAHVTFGLFLWPIYWRTDKTHFSVKPKAKVCCATCPDFSSN